MVSAVLAVLTAMQGATAASILLALVGVGVGVLTARQLAADVAAASGLLSSCKGRALEDAQAARQCDAIAFKSD